MRNRFGSACALLAVVFLVTLPTSVHAQTSAVGPYYATPSWDQTLACTSLASCPRFVVLVNFNNEAVLDRETGLVWERSPASDGVTLHDAEHACVVKTVGGRRGWRLPTISELSTLTDPTRTSPALPAGHPFLNVQLGQLARFFWTTTPSLVTDAPGYFDTFELHEGFVLAVANAPGSAQPSYWCVRGPGQPVVE